MTELRPLRPDVATLLDSLQTEPGPGAEAQTRVAAALSAALGIPVGPSEPGGGGGDSGGAGGEFAPDAGGASAAGDVAGAESVGQEVASQLTTAAGAAGATGGLTGAATAGSAGVAGSSAAGATVGSAVVTTLVKPLTLAAFISGSVVGGGTAVVVNQMTALPERPAQVVFVPAPQPVPLDVPLVKAETPTAEPPTTPLEQPPVGTTARRAQRTPPDPAEKPRRRAALSAERSLIDRARAALTRGRPDDALHALDEHQRRFADGQLTEEREGMRVLALIGAGRRTEAEPLARRFERRFPRSLLLPAIRSATSTAE